MDKPLGTQLELIACCPFCGCEADLRSAPNDYATHGGEVGLPGLDAFFVHCDGCGCDGPVGESESGALDLWNDRAAQPSAVPERWTDPTGFSVDMVKDEATNWTRRETGKQMLLNYAAMMEAQEVAHV